MPPRGHSTDPDDTLGRRVAERLAVRGMSQADLARRAGVSPAFVSDLIGLRKSTVRTAALRAFATVLGTSVDYLVGLTDNPSVLAGLLVADEPPDYAARKQDVASDLLPEDDPTIPRRVLHPMPMPKMQDRLLSKHAPLSQMTELRWRQRLGEKFLPVLDLHDDATLPIASTMMFDARIPLPPFLPPTAYALKISGDEMAPRYLKGELVYAVPERQRLPSLYAVVGLRVPDGPNRLTARRVAEYLDSGLLLTTEKDHAAKRDPVFASHENLISFHPIVMASDDRSV
jgi:transcriptional regulator with XRE-family HTH domain